MAVCGSHFAGLDEGVERLKNEVLRGKSNIPGQLFDLLGEDAAEQNDQSLLVRPRIKPLDLVRADVENDFSLVGARGAAAHDVDAAAVRLGPEIALI